jgi:hypothetical protein
MRAAVELAGVIDKFGDRFVAQYQPNTFIQHTLRDIQQCRTASLGTHSDVCASCGTLSVSYNSCRNRHCPKCQGSRQNQWVDDRMEQLLPVKHFHVVFTVPHELNEICLLDSRWFYSALFESVGQTLASFGYTHFGAETGAIAVLHTWGQNLSLHPHVHCIVPAAALSVTGRLTPITRKGTYLYPVANLSRVFRAKLLQSVERKLGQEGVVEQHKHSLHRAKKQPWVVYCKTPFGGPRQIVEYLGRYVHRVAISNHRLVSVDEHAVTFRYKDYRDGEKQKFMTLPGEEFLRRFCQHVLPRRFVKIRYFGMLNSRNRPALERARVAARVRPLVNTSTIEKRVERAEGKPRKCHHCGAVAMRCYEVQTVPRVRSPCAADVMPNALF